MQTACGRSKAEIEVGILVTGASCLFRLQLPERRIRQVKKGLSLQRTQVGNGRVSRGRCNYFIRSGKRMELARPSSEADRRPVLKDGQGITQGSCPSSSLSECAEKGKAMTIFAFLKEQSDT